METTPSTDAKAATRPYIFDGPIRFSRHSSPTVGRLTNLDDARLYSTWKMFLRGVRLFFSDDEKQLFKCTRCRVGHLVSYSLIIYTD